LTSAGTKEKTYLETLLWKVERICFLEKIAFREGNFPFSEGGWTFSGFLHFRKWGEIFFPNFENMDYFFLVVLGEYFRMRCLSLLCFVVVFGRL